MSFRNYIDQLAKSGELVTITEPVSTDCEISAVLKGFEPKGVMFESIHDSDFKVAGNIFPTKAAFGDYFGLDSTEIIPTLL